MIPATAIKAMLIVERYEMAATLNPARIMFELESVRRKAGQIEECSVRESELQARV